MSNELRNALALAAVGIFGLLIARMFASVADGIAIVTVIASVLVVWFTTQRAKKSSLRAFLMVTVALLVSSTFSAGVLLSATGVAMVLYILLGAFMTIMVYYHTARFLRVPAERSRQVLVRTVWAVQVYTIAAGVSSFFGFMILARMSSTWLLVLTALGMVAIVYPWYRFALYTPAQRFITTAIVVLVVTEVTWASSLLPFGFGVRGMFPAIAAAITLAFVAKVNGEQVRDKTMKILYAAAAISIGSIFILARWI